MATASSIEKVPMLERGSWRVSNASAWDKLFDLINHAYNGHGASEFKQPFRRSADKNLPVARLSAIGQKKQALWPIANRFGNFSSAARLKSCILTAVGYNSPHACMALTNGGVVAAEREAGASILTGGAAERRRENRVELAGRVLGIFNGWLFICTSALIASNFLDGSLVFYDQSSLVSKIAFDKKGCNRR